MVDQRFLSCLGFFVPLDNFSLIWRRYHYRIRVAMVLSQDPWHSHLLRSVWQWSCHYLFLRLRSVPTGDRTPIFRMRDGLYLYATAAVWSENTAYTLKMTSGNIVILSYCMVTLWEIKGYLCLPRWGRIRYKIKIVLNTIGYLSFQMLKVLVVRQSLLNRIDYMLS